MEKKKIVIPKAAFNRFKRLSAERASIDRQRKKLLDKWTSGGLLPVKASANIGEYVIVDTKGDEIGKATMYNKDAFTVPAHVEIKIS